MATLDFTELDKVPPGESFEALVRLIGERIGLVAQWSGRGPDQGRDLIFIESQKGPLRSRPVKWLVACKDNSIRGASVSEVDVGSIIDKVTQHDCNAFLLATTTTASSALKDKLDRLDEARGGTIQTMVWDRFEITKFLLEERCTDLLSQFFPKQAGGGELTLDAARKVIENALPRFVVGTIRTRLLSYEARLLGISGLKVWPHDSAQAELIDEMKEGIIRGRGIKSAAQIMSKLNFDAFTSFVDSLIRNFPNVARRVLVDIAETSSDSGLLFNVIETLREDDTFDLETELKLAKRFDADTLFDLYADLSKQVLEEHNVWDWRLPQEVLSHDDHVELLDVSVSDLEFSGGDGVNVSGVASLHVNGWSSDPERGGIGEDTYTVHFAGFWLPDGIELDEIK